MDNGNTGNRNGWRLSPGRLFAVLAGGWLLAWAIASCQAFPDNRSPRQAAAAPAPTAQPVPGANAGYLDTPAERARTAVDDAIEALAAAGTDAASARAALGEARQALDDLTGFYLPLTAARDLLVQAWYDQDAGRAADRDAHLAEAGNRLRRVVETGTPPAAMTAGELLTILDSLELHKTGDSRFADELRGLCTTVQDRLVAAGFDLDKTQDAGAPVAGAVPPKGATS